MFHSGCQIDCIAKGGVFRQLVSAKLSDDYQTRMNTDPDIQIHAMLALQLPSDSTDSLDDLQPGQNSALWIVFMRQRCAEEGKDPITSHPGQRAAVAAHGFHQMLKSAPYGSRPLLGIQFFGHSSGALDIAKKHGDNTALASEGGCLRRGNEA